MKSYPLIRIERAFFLATAIGFLLSSALAQAQMVQVWEQRYGTSDFPEEAIAIATDPAGDVIVAGNTGGSLSADIIVIKYSGAGIPLWTNRFSGPSNKLDLVSGLAVDTNGNAFVTGFTRGSSDRCLTIAYSNAGVPLWTNLFDRFGAINRGRGIAVDRNGDVIVTGYSDGLSTFEDYLTIKYSGAGVPLWTNFYGVSPMESDKANAIAVDTNGNVFVTGFSPSDDNGIDFVTIAYSSAGIPLWTNRCDGAVHGHDEATRIAVSESGTVFVTGTSIGTGSDYDYLTIAYSVDGTPLWTNRFDGPMDSRDEPKGIVADRNGNVFVTGMSTATNNIADGVTIAYSGTGAPLWTNLLRTAGSTYSAGLDIALDGNENIIVTGMLEEPALKFSFATIAYSGAGVPLWINTYAPTNGFAAAYAVAVDHNNNVFVSGPSLVNNDHGIATLKYSPFVPPPWLAIERNGNQIVLSWTNAGFGLQAAPAITGLFTNLPGATSPHTNSIAGDQMFFRLKAN